MKTAKITTAYCKDLLDRHYDPPTVFDPHENASDEIDHKLVKKMLEESSPTSRAKVSYDQNGDESTWDVLGPGLPYGHVYFQNREDAEDARDALNKILREHFGPVSREVQFGCEAHRNKVVLEGPCCPACGSSRVRHNETMPRNGVYIILKDCDGCNAEWREVYGLQSYQDLRID